MTPQILWESPQLLAIDKPATWAVQPDKTGDPSLLAWAETYLGCTPQLVHRIDRPVSGLVLLAKNAAAAAALSAQFQSGRVRKEYLAVVQNPPPQPAATLVHFLKKNEAKNTVAVFAEEKKGSKRAELHYQTLQHSERYQLLLVTLHSGRHHQIRAQLAAIGCPIKGDVKYGARRNNPDRSIHLHAWRLAFDDPATGQRVLLQAAPPDEALWRAFNIS